MADADLGPAACGGGGVKRKAEVVLAEVSAGEALAVGKGLKAPQDQPHDVLMSEGGHVEYRRPRTPTWPVVLSAPHGGLLKPDAIPDRTSGCLEPDWESGPLAEQVWEEFGCGAALVVLRLERTKIDSNRPRKTCCEGHETTLAAWEAYHGWIAEAAQSCVERFGFCLVLDLHGQSHRTGVTELGYLVNTDSLLLSDEALDEAAPVSSVGTFLRSSARGPAVKPGGLSALVRGSTSLGGYLEEGGFQCTPSPRQPRPVDAAVLEASRAAGVDAAVDKTATGAPAVSAADVTYFWGGYAARRYGAPGTVPKHASPLPEDARKSWAKHVAAIQLETSWLGVRDGPAQQRAFGKQLCWATGQLLQEWMGWTTPGPTR